MHTGKTIQGEESTAPSLKVKSNPITGLDRPFHFQEFEAHRFQDNRHMKVVRLSALRTSRLSAIAAAGNQKRM